MRPGGVYAPLSKYENAEKNTVYRLIFCLAHAIDSQTAIPVKDRVRDAIIKHCVEEQ